MDNNIIKEILNEADKSLDSLDIPVGAVIVKDSVIIGKGHNDRILNNNVLGHAEINAIKEAIKTLGDYRLNGCDLYVTLEPCNMCMEICKEARIDNIYFLLKKDNMNSYKKTNKCTIENFNEEKTIYADKLSAFFKDNLNR